MVCAALLDWTLYGHPDRRMDQLEVPEQQSAI